MKLQKYLEEFLGIFSLKNLLSALLLFWVYNFAAYALLANGISKTFAQEAIKGSSAYLVVSLIVGFIAAYYFKNLLTKLPHKSGDLKFDWYLVVLTLFPMTPITRYILLNQDLLTPLESLLFFMVSLAISVLLILVIPFILRNKINPLVSVAVGLSLTTLYFYMPVLSLENNWYVSGKYKDQIEIFNWMFVVTCLLYSSRSNFLYPVVIVVFVLNIGQVLFLEQEVDFRDFSKGYRSSGADPFVLEEKLKSSVLSTTPDIYLLTYDGYIPNEILGNYGIDNAQQETFLIENGFTVYSQTYSKEPGSMAAMSQMLNMTNEEAIHQRGVATSGNGSVFKILKSQGYKTYGVISSFFYRNLEPAYDVVLPKVKRSWHGESFFLLALAEGRFRFDIQKPKKHEMISAKRAVFAEDTKSPKALYNHTGPRHSQNSGKCLPDEIDQYHKRLQLANREMRDDIEAINSMERDAIIVINGDHGPYLLGDCSKMKSYPVEEITRKHLQDRFGAFVAIRWPEGTDISKYDINTVQDVFPAIFSVLFKDEDVWKNKPDEVTGVFRGSYIENGIIRGGVDDGKPLYP